VLVALVNERPFLFHQGILGFRDAAARPHITEMFFLNPAFCGILVIVGLQAVNNFFRRGIAT
jgi:hypothetical protein